MRRLVDHFDRAYVINLLDRPDRRRDTEREFRRIGIACPSEKIQFYTAIRPKEQGQFPSIGARGVFTSHRSVLDLAIKDGLGNVLIFEDDVSFRDAENDVVEEIVVQLSKECWDMTYFGYAFPSDVGLKGPLVYWPHKTIGTHFYAVHGRFLENMVGYMREAESRPRDHKDGGPTSADGIYNRVRQSNKDVRVLLASPMLAHQRCSRTDVQRLAFYDKIVWLEPAIRRARGIKHIFRMKLDKYVQHRRLSE